MRIKQLSGLNIKNRTFAHEINDVTVFYGPNGAGKSARLLAVELALQGPSKNERRHGNPPKASVSVLLEHVQNVSGNRVEVLRELEPKHKISVVPLAVNESLQVAKNALDGVVKCPPTTFAVGEFTALSPDAQRTALLRLATAIPASEYQHLYPSCEAWSNEVASQWLARARDSAKDERLKLQAKARENDNATIVVDEVAEKVADMVETLDREIADAKTKIAEVEKAGVAAQALSAQGNRCRDAKAKLDEHESKPMSKLAVDFSGVAALKAEREALDLHMSQVANFMTIDEQIARVEAAIATAEELRASMSAAPMPDGNEGDLDTRVKSAMGACDAHDRRRRAAENDLAHNTQIAEALLRLEEEAASIGARQEAVRTFVERMRVAENVNELCDNLLVHLDEHGYPSRVEVDKRRKFVASQHKSIQWDGDADEARGAALGIERDDALRSRETFAAAKQRHVDFLRSSKNIDDEIVRHHAAIYTFRAKLPEGFSRDGAAEWMRDAKAKREKLVESYVNENVRIERAQSANREADAHGNMTLQLRDYLATQTRSYEALKSSVPDGYDDAQAAQWLENTRKHVEALSARRDVAQRAAGVRQAQAAMLAEVEAARARLEVVKRIEADLKDGLDDCLRRSLAPVADVMQRFVSIIADGAKWAIGPMDSAPLGFEDRFGKWRPIEAFSASERAVFGAGLALALTTSRRDGLRLVLLDDLDSCDQARCDCVLATCSQLVAEGKLDNVLATTHREFLGGYLDPRITWFAV